MSVDVSHFTLAAPTYGAVLGPAMTVETQADADAYLAAMSAWLVAHGHARHLTAADQIARANICHFARCCSAETQDRVERLFSCPKANSEPQRRSA